MGKQTVKMLENFIHPRFTFILEFLSPRVLLLKIVNNSFYKLFMLTMPVKQIVLL